MNGIPIVLIVTCIIIGLCTLSGFLSGFVNKISGIVSFILACVLVSLLLPTITSALRQTAVYTTIRNQCEAIGNNLVRNVVVDSLGDGTSAVSDGQSVVQAVTADDGSGRLDRDKIKAELQARGYDPSVIDALSDAELESYAQQLIGATAGALSPAWLMSAQGTAPYCLLVCGNGAASVCPVLLADTASGNPVLLTDSTVNTAAGETAGTQKGQSLLSRLTSGMDRSEQIKFIEDLPIPDFLKEQMETFNNSTGYQKLGATDFGSYVISYIANLILNILAFLVTLLVSWIIIRLIFGALSVFASLPIIGGVNRLLGLVAGFVQGILIVWVLFLIISVFASTPAGKTLMDEINNTPVLETLYNTNFLMKSTANALKGIL